jgi:polysaccharide export outer membrane protein
MSHTSNSVFVTVLAVFLSCGSAQSSAQSEFGNSTNTVNSTSAPNSTGAGNSTSAGNSAVDPEQSSVINNGDMLDVQVFESPDLSTKARVGENGDVLLPLTGKVHLQGLDVADASAVIRTRLMERRFVKDPRVTVTITEYATRGVSLLGEVKKPGIYTAMGSHRLNDYISLAEGLTQQAGTQVSITHRAAPDKSITVRISNIGKPTPGSNPLVESGDTIVVPKAGQVYVVGDVVRPGGYLMDHDEQLTIVQALALAQGANKTALLKHSVIIRKTDTGRKEIPVNLEKVLSTKSTDLTLLDDDILFIPVSRGKTVVNRSIEAIVQTAVGTASFRPF